MNDITDAAATAEIKAALRTAISMLDAGWDWPQDFADKHGVRHVIDGEAYIDDLPDETARAAAREYAEFVRGAYATACAYAEHALDALAAGDMTEARDLIDDAARYERETGDEAAMGRPLAMVTQRIECGTKAE